MRPMRLLALAALVLATPLFLNAADNLVLNPKLDYSEHNKRQGLLFTGDHMDEGLVEGKVNYIYFYIEKCYNAKRQARVTYHMYQKYGSRVHFVPIDLNLYLSSAQMKLARKFLFRIADIPHTTIIDSNGGLIFDFTGEADETTMSGWIDYALRSGESGEQLAHGTQALPAATGSSSRGADQP